MAQYFKRPTPTETVEAVQLGHGSPGWYRKAFETGRIRYPDNSDCFLIVMENDGDPEAQLGDWLLFFPDTDELTICPKDEFYEKYIKVGEENRLHGTWTTHYLCECDDVKTNALFRHANCKVNANELFSRPFPCCPNCGDIMK